MEGKGKGKVKDGATHRLTIKPRRSVKLRLDLHACSNDMAFKRVSCLLTHEVWSEETRPEGQHDSEFGARLWGSTPSSSYHTDMVCA